MVILGIFMFKKKKFSLDYIEGNCSLINKSYYFVYFGRRDCFKELTAECNWNPECIHPGLDTNICDHKHGWNHAVLECTTPQ